MNTRAQLGVVAKLLCLLPLWIVPLESNAQSSRPAYAIVKEAYSVEYLGDRRAIKVTASFTVRNSGVNPLHAFRFRFPDETFDTGIHVARGDDARNEAHLSAFSALHGFQLDTFEAIVGGERISPGDRRLMPDQGAIALRFDPPIQAGSSRELSVEYVLFRQLPDNAGIAMDADYFHLGGTPWWLRVMSEQGTEATVVQPETRSLKVLAPAGFRVLCATPEGSRPLPAQEPLIMSRGSFPPFCFGGRYREHRVAYAGQTVVFWLISEFSPELVRKAGEWVATTATVYQQSFGPSKASSNSWWVAEMSVGVNFSERRVPSMALGKIAASVATYSGSFPGGVLISTPLLELGLGSDAVLKMMDGELAQSWFGFTTQAVPFDGLRWGLANYAILLAELSRRGDGARGEALSRHIRRYDEASARVPKKLPLTWSPPLDDPDEPDWNQRFLIAGRGAFLLDALEDVVGRAALQQAIRKFVQGGRGHTAGFEDLRRAIEAESGKKVGHVFDAWLKSTEIPAGFRSQYAAK